MRIEPLPQRHDRWNRAAGTLPRAEFRHLLGHDRFSAVDFRTASRQVLLHDCLQIVDVVEEDLLDVADRCLNVARHGDVDDEQRIAPLRRPASTCARVMIGRCDPVAVTTMSEAASALRQLVPGHGFVRRPRPRAPLHAPEYGS